MMKNINKCSVLTFILLLLAVPLFAGELKIGGRTLINETGNDNEYYCGDIYPAYFISQYRDHYCVCTKILPLNNDTFEVNLKTYEKVNFNYLQTDFSLIIQLNEELILCYYEEVDKLKGTPSKIKIKINDITKDKIVYSVLQNLTPKQKESSKEIDSLLDDIRSDSSETRLKAIKNVREQKRVDALPYLKHRIDYDSDYEVKLAAIECLIDLNIEEGNIFLLNIYKNKKTPKSEKKYILEMCEKYNVELKNIINNIQ